MIIKYFARLDEPVHQRSFSVVNVGYYGYISQFYHGILIKRQN
jgi:hypothetical protein